MRPHPAEDPGFTDLGFARVDTDRAGRTGHPEVVYAEGKTPGQTVAIVGSLRAAHPDRAVLATRVPDETATALRAAHPGAVHDATGRTVTVGPLPAPAGDVLVVCAGTSDLPVAAECLATLAAFGAGAELLADVGVAGVHRVLAAQERLHAADVVVVVAGMDGALPSVVGGLARCPVVAVPTSVGLRRGLRRAGAAADDAELLRPGGDGGEHRQRVRRRRGRGPDRPRAGAGPGPAVSRVGWLDLSCGVSGDMLLGALHALGAVDAPALPAALGLDAGVTVAGVRRAGLAATQVSVTPGADQPARRWADVRALVAAGAVPEHVRVRALAVLERLAVAEAAVHGVALEDVHFHEVGAVDSVIDVVGACWGLHALGLDALHAGPLALGAGTVRTGHGVLPVPVPAVLALLEGSAAPVFGGPEAVELATPTGVAVLLEHVTGWGAVPAMTVSGTGAGAGSKDFDARANVVRLVVGHAATTATGEPDAALLLETNVDDLDPRIWPRVIERCLAAGASDAWLTPIVMKKGRPAHTLHVLVAAAAADDVRAVVFAETTTLGLRESRVGKTALGRSFVHVEVDGEPVAVKLGHAPDGTVVNAQPEWADVAAAADALGLPAKVVLARASAAARESSS